MNRTEAAREFKRLIDDMTEWQRLYIKAGSEIDLEIDRGLNGLDNVYNEIEADDCPDWR